MTTRVSDTPADTLANGRGAAPATAPAAARAVPGANAARTAQAAKARGGAAPAAGTVGEAQRRVGEAQRRRGPDRVSTPAQGPAAVTVVTVGEVQRLLLPGGRVVGGAAGLNRQVTWATSLRLRPPAFEPHGGGEFVLASGDALESLRQSDASLSLARILEGLAEAGAAALAVPPPVPAEAAAAADAVALPLLELTDGASRVEVERAIIGLVVDSHNALQARASQFYRQLAQLIVEERGLDAIVHEAATAAGRIVAFEDGQFRLRLVATPPAGSAPPVDDAGLSSADERGRLNAAVRLHPVSSTNPAAVLVPAARWRLARYVAPVVTRERLRGFVSLCAPLDALTEFDQLAASRLAAICAIALTNQDAVLATEQRVQGDLVDELLRPSADLEAAARRAAQAGLSADGTFAIFAIGPDEHGGRGGDHAVVAIAEGVSRRLRQTSRPALTRAGATELLVVCELRAGRQGAPSGAGPLARGLSPAEGSDHDAVERRLRQVGEDLLAAAAEEAGGAAVCAGASRPNVGLRGLPNAALEAREALRIGRRVYGAGRLTAYADLGLYRVLHALRDTMELRTFFDQTLGPLVEYDRKTGQNWIETLEVFFACHGNLSETAERLDLHRNTLLYRIGRLEEIGGFDLDDPETRLSLQVALKARRLLT